MRSFRALLLLGLAATLAFTPAAQDAQQKFVDEVNKRADLLRRERQELEAVCKAQEANLKEIVDDWQRGFDPALIKPVADNAEAQYKKQVADLTTQLNVKRTYPELEAEAKKQKWTDVAKVKTPLGQCKTAYDLARPYLSTAVETAPYGKLAAHYKSVRQRIADAAKSGSGVKGTPTNIIVGKAGLQVCRVYGGKAAAEGNWWFEGSTPPSACAGRKKWALPPTNYCEMFLSIKFKEGAHLQHSYNAPLFGFTASEVTGEQYQFDWEWHQKNDAPAPWHPDGKLKSSRWQDWSERIGGGAVPKIDNK